MQSPKFSIVEIIPNFLQQNQGKLFSAQELAQWIFENHPNGCREKFERSKNKKIKVLEDIVDQIRSEVGSILIVRIRNGNLFGVSKRGKTSIVISMMQRLFLIVRCLKLRRVFNLKNYWKRIYTHC